MQFVFNTRSAKKLARSLEKFFARNGIELVHGQALDALAAMQGHADWNSLAARIHPGALRSELCDFERTHMRESRGQKYGREGELRAHTGFALRYPLETEGCEYVRVVDPFGREIAYWDHKEWQRDPSLVMGAILGAVVRGQRDPSASNGVDPEVVLKTPLTVYVETYSGDCNWARVPGWAKIVFTQEKLDALLRLREVVHQADLVSATKYDGPEVWEGENDEQEPLRMEMGELIVMDSVFYFTARLKHQDAEVETVGIDFEPFLKAIAGPRDEKNEYFERHGDLMVWGSGGDHIIEAAHDAGEDVGAWWSEHPSRILADH